MQETTEKNLNIKVVKRNGKKVDFNGTKIAMAIKKGFDSVEIENAREEELKYSADDANKVYNMVLQDIENSQKDSIKIEEIQDFIEKELKCNGYQDVYESFSEYRERRAKSRDAFSDEKRLHKFLKAIENLGLKAANEENAKRENANINGNTAMGTMLEFGSTLSKEFSKTYLIKKQFAQAHENGDIHIHDMDFLPMGTTTCCQIELDKLFKDGFSTGNGHIREPKDIMSYGALAAIAIQANQNDQHGGQSIPAFDYYMAPGVLKTFKKQFKQTIYDILEFTNFDKFIAMNGIEREIDKLNTIEFDITIFDKFTREAEELKKLFRMSYDKAIKKTDRITYQAMEAFIHNVNTMHSRAGAQVPFSSVNFGTDTSPEGRMVIKNFLLATEAGLGNNETPIFPISIFKIKDGVNYKEGDPNYDLFKLSCRVTAKRLFPNFSFLDSTFNAEFYKEGDYNTEVAYMGCRTRVLANVADPDRAVTGGRGNLSFTTVNLPRLGIKHGILNGNEKPDLQSFFEELDEKLELIKDQLLERFELQCNKRSNNFPFLIQQGVWIDGEKVGPNDKLRKVLKHGTLTIGFIGLAECLKALTGKHHAESEEANKLGIEIIKHIRKKADEYAEKYKLNFSVIGTPAEGLSGRFTEIDRAVYGKIEGITDKEYYTNSFHVPVNYNISVADKIKIEAPYHAFTNGGHITYVELDGDTTQNPEVIEKIVRIMKENNIGYGAINHPVDRDPVCGFSGVINDVCPGCGRKEDDVPFERIRRITGYLVGTTDRWNNAKLAELRDRVKHDSNENI